MNKKKILKKTFTLHGIMKNTLKIMGREGGGKACKIKRFQRELRQKCFSFSVFGTKPSPYKSIKSEDTLSL